MNLGQRETAIYCGPEGMFWCGIVPVFTVWVQCFWWEGSFRYECQPCFSSECAGHYPLDRQCDWYCVQNLHWMLSEQGFLFILWLSQLCLGWGLFSSFSVEALSHVDKASLPLRLTQVCKTCAVTANLYITMQEFAVLPRNSPSLCLCLCYVHPSFSSRLVPGMGLCSCRNWGGCAATWDQGFLCFWPLQDLIAQIQLQASV